MTLLLCFNVRVHHPYSNEPVMISLRIGVSLSDEMSFSLLPEQASRDELVCSDKTLAIDDSNLVIKVVKI